MVPTRLPTAQPAPCSARATLATIAKSPGWEAQAADALAYARQRGSPNIATSNPRTSSWTRWGTIWITDFGLAKFKKGDDPLAIARPSPEPCVTWAPEPAPRCLESPVQTSTQRVRHFTELLALRPPKERQDQLSVDPPDRDQPAGSAATNQPPYSPDLETIGPQEPSPKGPEKRSWFDSAEEMANELQRFVENRPIRTPR